MLLRGIANETISSENKSPLERQPFQADTDLHDGSHNSAAPQQDHARTWSWLAPGAAFY